MSVLIFFGVLYQFFGLRYYLKATEHIQNLPYEDRLIAEAEFYGDKDGGTVGGIMAGFFMDKVFVWSNGRLKMFTTDEYSVYSYYEACIPEILDFDPVVYPESSIDRDVYGDKKQFLNKVGNVINNGLLVSIAPTMEKQGGTIGNLRELWAYDWWNFVKGGILEKCKK